MASPKKRKVEPRKNTKNMKEVLAREARGNQTLVSFVSFVVKPRFTTSRAWKMQAQCRWAGSCEAPVDEPARRLIGLVRPGAERPEAASVHVLDGVVVANVAGTGEARSGVAPPFAGDALGPIGVPHPMMEPAPAEHQGRIVGHRRRRLDRLGRGEKADWAVGAARPGLHHGSIEHRQDCDGALGQMAFARRQAMDIGEGGTGVR